MKIKLSKSQWQFIGKKAGWMKTASYCPKCKSKLYPDDEEPMEAVGVCGGCVSYDNTPDKRLQKKLEEYKSKKAKRKDDKHDMLRNLR